MIPFYGGRSGPPAAHRRPPPPTGRGGVARARRAATLMYAPTIARAASTYRAGARGVQSSSGRYRGR